MAAGPGGPPYGSFGPPDPPGPPGLLGPPGARPRAMSNVSRICCGFSCWTGSGGSSPPGTMVREMVSVFVARVCVDIAKLQFAFVRTGVPCCSFLSQCGLPGLFASISARVLLICTSIEGVDLSSVSGYTGVGYTSMWCPLWYGCLEVRLWRNLYHFPLVHTTA